MDYQEALNYLFSQLPMFQRVGPAAYKADLSRTIELCSQLDNPQDKYPGIHIAGTNGKGSVASLVAASLQSAGYKTGLFTSPHLIDFRERIKVNGEMISQDFVAAFVERVRIDLEQVQASFFEMSYAMAASYFADQDVDIVVWETGMGGRLDSTNIIIPVLSIITNIGLDHTQFLGTTLQEIAREKGGIIKQGVPAVLGRHQEECDLVFEEIASDRKSDIYYAQDQCTAMAIDYNPWSDHMLVDINCKLEQNSRILKCGLPGIYQLENIQTAFAAVCALKSQGFDISDQAIFKGFRDVRKLTGIAGRWLKISENPRVICDTGHNADGIRAVVSLLESLSFDQLMIVFGTVDDKDISEVLALMPRDARYFFCRADVPRAMDAEKLALLASDHGLTGNIFPTCIDALNAARNSAHADDLIFIGGSTFVLADILKSTM